MDDGNAAHCGTAVPPLYRPCTATVPHLPYRRYISEDYGGMALHPIDLLDAATGEHVRAAAVLVDEVKRVPCTALHCPSTCPSTRVTPPHCSPRCPASLPFSSPPQPLLPGALVGEMTDPNVATICPVNKPHPRLDLIGERSASAGPLHTFHLCKYLASHLLLPLLLLSTAQ